MVDQPAASFPSTPARTTMPECYSQLLDAIAQRVSLGRLSATTAVNRELTATNWAIGRLILDQQNEAGWGAGVIERLSADLKNVFPGSSGFSPRNLRYMRTFAQMWPDRSMSSCVESFEQSLSARFLGSVDADDVGRRGCGRLAAEPFGVRGVVGLLGGVALLPEGAPAPVVDLIR